MPLVIVQLDHVSGTLLNDIRVKRFLNDIACSQTIVISDGILLKPGKLTNEEFEVMKSHTTRGCDIIDMLRRKGRLVYPLMYQRVIHVRHGYDLCSDRDILSLQMIRGTRI